MKLEGSQRPQKAVSDGFVAIDKGPRNIDRWLIRTTILAALRRAYPLFHGDLLDIGCGKMPYRAEILRATRVSAYVGLDIESALVYDATVRPDITWDGTRIPVLDKSFDVALATEVFEHVSDLDRLLGEIRRVLRPGGVLFFTTPFVWPYHEMPNDCQRWTAPGLAQRLDAAAFRDVAITSEGNWHSALAQMIGLWVARAPMPRSLRFAIRYPAFAIQKVLLLGDRRSAEVENAMPYSITGTARI